MAPRQRAGALLAGLGLLVFASAPGCGSDKRTGQAGDAGDTAVGADVALGGVLVVSEVMSYAPDRALSYVELQNPGPDAISLAAFNLVRYAPGDTAGRAIALPAETLAAGAVWTIGTTAAASGAYESAFGRAVDQTSDEVTGGGEDAWATARDGEVIDLYGVVGATGEAAAAFRATDAVAVRFPGAAATTTWQPGDWMIATELAVETFGEPNWPFARFDAAGFGEVRFAP
ncbi:MAG: lamin tail domain-containing protein [Deltaproteobacteria bacterium]|nr:lamin tail domain-containing protein [Deltaproteobacteria bacterium]